MKRTELNRYTPLRRSPFPRKPRRKNPPRTIPRSRKYLEFIREQRCLINNGACTYMPIEAAHTGPHGMGIKGSDLLCLPLCRWHHQIGPESYHQLGEKRFLQHWGINLERTIQDLQRRFAQWDCNAKSV